LFSFLKRGSLSHIPPTTTDPEITLWFELLWIKSRRNQTEGRAALSFRFSLYLRSSSPLVP
jgi:hypothetical protein